MQIRICHTVNCTSVTHVEHACLQMGMSNMCMPRYCLPSFQSRRSPFFVQNFDRFVHSFQTSVLHTKTLAFSPSTSLYQSIFVYFAGFESPNSNHFFQFVFPAWSYTPLRSQNSTNLWGEMERLFWASFWVVEVVEGWRTKGCDFKGDFGFARTPELQLNKLRHMMSSRISRMCDQRYACILGHACLEWAICGQKGQIQLIMSI